MRLTNKVDQVGPLARMAIAHDYTCALLKKDILLDDQTQRKLSDVYSGEAVHISPSLSPLQLGHTVDTVPAPEIWSQPPWWRAAGIVLTLADTTLHNPHV